MLSNGSGKLVASLSIIFSAGCYSKTESILEMLMINISTLIPALVRFVMIVLLRICYTYFLPVHSGKDFGGVLVLNGKLTLTSLR